MHKQTCFYVGSFTEKQFSDSVEALTKLCIWLIGNSCESFESQSIYVDETSVADAIYDLTYNRLQGRPEPSLIQCYMMSENDRSSIENTEVPTQEGEENATRSTEEANNNISALRHSERTAPQRTFGVSVDCEYVPAERINIIHEFSKEPLCA